MNKLFTIILLFLTYIAANISYSQRVQLNGPNGGWVRALAGSSTNVILGFDNNSSGLGGIYKSSNDGQNWILSGFSGSSVNSIVYSDSKYFTGLGNSIYYSTNYGQNWIQTNYNHSSNCIAVNSPYIFAANNNLVYFSSDNGTNWVQRSFTSQYIHSIFINGLNILAGTNGGGILTSTDNGETWTQSDQNDAYIYCFAKIGSTIFAGGSPGMFISTNFGFNWTLSDLDSTIVRSMVVYGTNILAGTVEGAFLSTNNGISWIKKDEGFTGTLNILSLAISNNYFYAGTLYSFVWRRPISDLIGIHNISSEIISGFNLYQNYPNPFNPITKIKFDVPKSSNIKLIVYNSLGQEISILADEKVSAGTYETEFNGEKYPSGIYFYRIITNDFTQTNKMILLK